MWKTSHDKCSFTEVTGESRGQLVFWSKYQTFYTISVRMSWRYLPDPWLAVWVSRVVCSGPHAPVRRYSIWGICSCGIFYSTTYSMIIKTHAQSLKAGVQNNEEPQQQKTKRQLNIFIWMVHLMRVTCRGESHWLWKQANRTQGYVEVTGGAKKEITIFHQKMTPEIYKTLHIN